MSLPDPNQSIELGQLLAGAVSAVVEAQDVLDRHAEAQKVRYAETPDGTLAIPPLWYAFRRVDIEVELSAEFSREWVTPSGQTQGALEPRLRCRLLNPTSVGLFGYQASSGLRVQVVLEPQGRLEAGSDPESSLAPQNKTPA